MKNKSKLVEVIKSGCKHARGYVSWDGSTCAIGALAVVAGVSMEELGDYKATSNAFFITSRPDLSEPIYKMFGLSVEEQKQIQFLNDENYTPEERQAAILSYLDTLTEEHPV